MKEIPMLFKTPMVVAINEDRKKQTRRIRGLEEINNNPDDWQFEWADYSLKYPFRFTQKSTVNEKTIAERSFYQAECKCPYGQPGDVLWVRETFYAFGHWVEDEKENGKTKLRFVDETTLHGHSYKYFENPPIVSKKRLIGLCAWYKRPSIHMPKEACRTKLLVKSERVERLQDITEDNAELEGVESWPIPFSPLWAWKNYLDKEEYTFTARESFGTLWQSINGPESLEANPWVWVIEFERI